MAKSKRFKSVDASGFRFPDEKELKKVREELSDDRVTGSTVLGPDASLVDQIKYRLCGKIVEYRRTRGISQKDLANLLGVDEPEMSRILHYKIDRYTIDRLLSYLEVLYPNIKFDVSAA